ncbi:MAG TPA: ribonuclease Y [Anaerolineales bacterium]|nr:ribonuclease Y [Anaerolineales bacterium]
MDTITIVAAVIAGLVGIGAGYYLREFFLQRATDDLKSRAKEIISEAEKRSNEIEIQARDKSLEILRQAEAEVNNRRQKLNQEEDRLGARRTSLDDRADRLENLEQRLSKRQGSLDRRANEVKEMHDSQVQRLEQISQMTRAEAADQLLREAETEARNDMARIIRQVEAEAREEGQRRARELIAMAIQRVASEHVNDITTSTVALPSDEMKGRIIGRAGRNIRTFEQMAGVDVIVDDTPETITISCFDPVRREVARRSMERLILDGRIHPAHIEKIINQELAEIERVIEEAGETAAYDAGVAGLPKGITRVLGRLKYRTSYGQNQLSHAVESSRLAAILAAELGADIDVAKMGGLLHDLGKAIDHNVEGTHAGIGADLAKRNGLPQAVVNAIASHHHEVEQETVEAVIVEAADAISGARPGARRESLDDYIKRIKSLEDLAKSFEGVEESFAIQAGREVRIIVKPGDIDDLGATRMARDVAKKIEENMQYPGQIKVTVIRETRATDYAK